MERVHLSEVEPLASKAQKEGTHIIHNLILFHTCLPAHALTTTKKLLYFLQLKGSHAQHLGSIEQCFVSANCQPNQNKKWSFSLVFSSLRCCCFSFLFFYLFLRVFVISEFVIGLSILNFTGKFDGSGDGFQEAPFRPWNGAVQVGDRGTATRRACSSQQALQIFIHFTRGLSSFLIDTYTCTRGCNSFNFWIRGVLNDVI